VSAGVASVVGTGCSSELPDPLPTAPEESGEPTPLVLGETSVGVGVGVGVGVDVGAVVAVGGDVTGGCEVGAGEEGADAVGVVTDPARVAGQLPDPWPPLPDEVPPRDRSCGETVAEAVGVAVALAP